MTERPADISEEQWYEAVLIATSRDLFDRAEDIARAILTASSQAYSRGLEDAARHMEPLADRLIGLCAKARSDNADKAFLNHAHDEVGLFGIDLLNELDDKIRALGNK